MNRQRRYRLNVRALARFTERVLAAVGKSGHGVAIVFVGDRTIRHLNREFRGIDRPTDVLSFPFGETEPDVPGSPPYLGDVIISVETARRYAARWRISLDRELRNLIIHGVLHLCGYDHETDQGEMRRLERRLRRTLPR
ncbi:MAG: rRNA maturation RNase YbeY [Acidobacteriota bacterium]|nr:rRNA maturation RNase YbeY [Acidobacteriota bacterium]